MNLIFQNSNNLFTKICFLVFLFIQSCGISLVSENEKNQTDSLQVDFSQTQNISQQLMRERESLKKERKYLRYYLQSFMKIQKELNRISHEKQIMIGPSLKEGRENRGEKILRFIGALEDQISITEKSIANLSHFNNNEINQLKEQIKDYKTQLLVHKNEINELKRNNYELSQKIISLNADISQNIETIDKQGEIINQMDTELQKKYCFVILKDNFVQKEIKNKSIMFDIKVNKKDLISYHPLNSFLLNHHHGQTTLKINNWEEFWKLSNSLIIRTNKKICRIE